MSIRLPQNPGIGGIDELTADEELFVQNIAGLSYSTGDVLYYDGANIINLGVGSNGDVLTLAAGVPSWAAGGGTGDVVGPSSATNEGIVRFDGTTGKLVANTGIKISDSDIISQVTRIELSDTGTFGSFMRIVSTGASITATYGPSLLLEYQPPATAIASGDTIGLIKTGGFTDGVGSNNVNRSFEVAASENWSATNQGSTLRLLTTPNTSVTEAVALEISNAGLISILLGDLDIAASKNLSFGGTAILADSAGTMTLSNIDAIDATTEATLEAALDHDDLAGFVANEHIDWTTDQGATNIDSANITGVDASIVNIALGGGSPTVDQIQEYIDNTGSSGYFLGGELSDGGAGTIDVAAGSGFIRTTNDNNAELQSFKWSASSGLAITDNTTQYIYVDDSGTVTASSDEFLETPDKIMLGVVTDEGGSIIHSFSLGVRLDESIGQMGRYIRRVEGIKRDTRKGGLIFGQSGDANRDLTMTAGSLWWGRTEYSASAVDTSGADTFFTYSAGGQEDAAASQWPNAQYDNSGTLTTMTNNRWANLFFFLEPDGHIVMMYGRDQFVTEAQAENEGVPSSSLPSRISDTSILAARYTFEKSANTATISSAFEELFANAGVTNHGNLAGLTDDDHTQYLLADGSRELTNDMTVTALKTIDGRDLSVDGIKLDTIENSADVTDTTNVTAAGALMDSEVDADLKTLALPANTTISTFGATVIDDANAGAARTTLDVDQAGTDNSTDVTLSGTGTYISLTGQDIQVDPITESDISDLGSYITASSTDTLTNKTLTAPKIADAGFIADANGNEQVVFQTTASAVNHLEITNAATGNSPVITAVGDSANIGMIFQIKGDEAYKFKATASGPTVLELYEDTSNGTTHIEIKAPASLAAHQILTLPDATDTLIGKATTDTLTNKTFDANGTGNSLSNVDLSADVTGDLPVGNLNSGTSASGSTFWRGDGTWATPAGSGDVSGPGSSTDNAIVRWNSTSGTLVLDSGITLGDNNDLSFTIADTSNVDGLTITQNDTTNNGRAVRLVSAVAQTIDGDREMLALETTHSSVAGPFTEYYHNSSTPAASDYMGQNFYFNNSTPAKTFGGGFSFELLDATAGSEDTDMYVRTRLAGTNAIRMIVGANGNTAINGISVGANTAACILSSYGTQDLVLQTGNATTGTITITDGANGAINIAPNGSGEAQIGGEKIIDETDTASTTAAGIIEIATATETDTGTDATRAITPDGFQDSKRNIRWLSFNLVEAATDCATATNIAGDFVSPIAGTILQSDTTPFYIYATNSTAGTTGTMVVDVHLNGTTIMTTNKLDFDSTEKTTTTAATPPDLTTTALAVGDIITIDIDSIHTTAAKGLTVYIAVRES